MVIDNASDDSLSKDQSIYKCSSNMSSEVQIKSSLVHKLGFSKFLEKQEDRPTPDNVYNWRIYATALFASSAAMIIGYDSGFIGGTVALPGFKEEFGLDKMTTSHANFIISNVISVFHAGCFFGALISYPFSYYFGRRISLIIAAATVTVGSAIMLAASKEHGLAPLYVGRAMAGLAVGFSTNLTPVYLAEISPPGIRGQVTSLYEFNWRNGDLIGFWINYGISSHIGPSKKQWLIPFAIQLIPSGLFLLGSIIMKESPRWLFSVNRHEEAIKNLTWLRDLPADNEYIVYEISQIEESLEYQRTHFGSGLIDPAREVFSNKKTIQRLGLTCTLFLFQNFLGIQSINYYSPIIFQSLGVKGTNSTLFSTGMFGVVKYIVTLIYIFFIVDVFGRRKAFMCSSTVCAICFWYIGAYLKVNDPTKPGVTAGPGGTAAIVMMYVWIASFIAAWSGGPFVVGGEVFDQNIRSFCQAINAAVSWVPIFVMSRYTTNMIAAMHYGIYFLFASLAVLSVPFVFFFIPETKGIALEDMDKLFDRSLPARSANKIVLGLARKEADLQLKDKTHEILSIAANKASTEHVEV